MTFSTWLRKITWDPNQSIKKLSIRNTILEETLAIWRFLICEAMQLKMVSKADACIVTHFSFKKKALKSLFVVFA
jgi:hypothetical protein